jgi:hypothetical protein
MAWRNVFNIRNAGSRLMYRCVEILFVEPDIKAVNCKKNLALSRCSHLQFDPTNKYFM